MNVLTKNIENRNQVEFVSLEQVVPANHLLRQIDAAIDFNRIYEFVGDLYCKDNGRPSIDPVVLFKIVLIQHNRTLPLVPIFREKLLLAKQKQSYYKKLCG